MPGTGKTATVHAVVKELKRKAEDGVSSNALDHVRSSQLTPVRNCLPSHTSRSTASRSPLLSMPTLFSGKPSPALRPHHPRPPYEVWRRTSTVRPEERGVQEVIPCELSATSCSLEVKAHMSVLCSWTNSISSSPPSRTSSTTSSTGRLCATLSCSSLPSRIGWTCLSSSQLKSNPG